MQKKASFEKTEPALETRIAEVVLRPYAARTKMTLHNDFWRNKVDDFSSNRSVFGVGLDKNH